ncbi:DUF1330 domain-containing protein [Mesorhizobium sp.]|uniref:DUF1330 domain-containing protein n=1 Tax=Mesorhizobium sp. TaxID=1871066 RepID=UPI0035653A07
MAAYMICTMTVHDAETYKKYTAVTPGTLARYGGRFLTRGEPVTTSEGEPFRQRMVILEFPDRASAEAWYNDPEYQRVSEFRRAAASDGRMILQEGRPQSAAPDPLV